MPPVTVASVEVGGCTVRRRGALVMVRTVRVMATVTKEQENVSATQVSLQFILKPIFIY